jgi:hypothetical protein
MKKLLILLMVTGSLNAEELWPNSTANSKGLKMIFINTTPYEVIIRAYYEGTTECYNRELMIDPQYDFANPGEDMFETGTGCCLKGFKIFYENKNAAVGEDIREPQVVFSASQLNDNRGLCYDTTFMISSDEHGNITATWEEE